MILSLVGFGLFSVDNIVCVWCWFGVGVLLVVGLIDDLIVLLGVLCWFDCLILMC